MSAAVRCFVAEEVRRPSGRDVMWRWHRPMPSSHRLWNSGRHVGISADGNSAAESHHWCVSFTCVLWLNIATVDWLGQGIRLFIKLIQQ